MPGQGRPLGFLIAWLRRAADIGYASRDEHYVARFDVTRAERESARAWAATRPEFAFFLAQERPPHPGEGDEPADFHII